MLVKAVSVQNLRAYSSFRTGSVLRPCCTTMATCIAMSHFLLNESFIYNVLKAFFFLIIFEFHYKYIFKCHALRGHVHFRCDTCTLI